MSFDEIGMTVNSDFNVPLNHLIWLQDYKTFGEDSYVFQNKDILHELYASVKISMNDSKIKTEAYNWLIDNDVLPAGKIFSSFYELKGLDGLSDVRSLDDLFSNDTYYTAISNEEKIVELILQNGKSYCYYSEMYKSIHEDINNLNNFINNESAMDEILSSKPTLNLLYENHEVAVPILEKSSYLLSSAQKSCLYEVVKKEIKAEMQDVSPKTIYDGRVYVLGISSQLNSSWKEYAFTFKGTTVATAGNSDSGLHTRVNDFAEKAQMAIYYNSDAVSTYPYFMAIIKID